MRPLWLFVLTILVTACSGGSVSTEPDSQVPNQQVDSRGGRDPAQDKNERAVAQLGDVITLSGPGRRSRVRVTATQVGDPVTSTNSFDKPARGSRFVAVQFEVDNVGQAVYSYAPENGAVLIDDQGQTFNATIFGGNPSLGPTFASPLKVLPGSSALGVIVFEVPTGSKLAAVQFGLASGFAESGQWALPAAADELQPYAGDIFTVEVLQVGQTSVDVRFCATAPYQGGPIPVTRARWSVRGDDGAVHPALPTDVPGGYPVETTVPVGTCVQGTVPMALPRGVSITQVSYKSSLGAVDWPV